MKRNNDPFNTHVEWICGKCVSSLCPFVGFFPASKHTLQCKEGQYHAFTALTHLSYLISGHPMGLWTKPIVPKRAVDEPSMKQRSRQYRARLIRQQKKFITEGHNVKWMELLSPFFVWISVSLNWAIQQQTIHLSLYSPAPTARYVQSNGPFVPAVLSVRHSDETQTDYLVWMAFPEQQKGQHNNR